MEAIDVGPSPVSPAGSGQRAWLSPRLDRYLAPDLQIPESWPLWPHLDVCRGHTAIIVIIISLQSNSRSSLLWSNFRFPSLKHFLVSKVVCKKKQGGSRQLEAFSGSHQPVAKSHPGLTRPTFVCICGHKLIGPAYCRMDTWVWRNPNCPIKW